jgi:LysR family transcriptional regulator, glycine cleavage system transcriptional activator
VRHLPPLGELRAFEAAARHLSFKSAAEELGVTSTAISHHIRQLEERFGRTLFRRHPRPLSLTETGAELYPVLRDGFDRFDAAIVRIGAKSASMRALRLTATNVFAHRWLVPRLPLWREAHPGLPLEINGTDAVLDLEAGETDLAFRYQRHAPTAFAAHELFRDTFWPVCHPALLTKGPICRMTDLTRYPLIDLLWGPQVSAPPTWRSWFQAARAISTEVPEDFGPCALSFREEGQAIQAVLAGQGIAILGDVYISHELKQGSLVKAFDLSLPGFGYYLTYLLNHPRQPDIQAFISWVRSVI